MVEVEVEVDALEGADLKEYGGDDLTGFANALSGAGLAQCGGVSAWPQLRYDSPDQRGGPAGPQCRELPGELPGV